MNSDQSHIEKPVVRKTDLGAAHHHPSVDPIAHQAFQLRAPVAVLALAVYQADSMTAPMLEQEIQHAMDQVA